MKCPNCDHSNKAGARFCGECGASLAAAASKLTCPACGFANRRGVRFCEECGADLSAATTLRAQPAPPPRAGMPGWAWALISLGVVAISALALILLWQVLPLRPAAPISTVPAGRPAVLVTVTAGGSAAASTAFCPQAGGVILFWNADYNCDNDQGDPGYRERYGDGWQDFNNLHFDDQASAVMIPQGWSVKLYEGSGRTGANVCFNTSVTDFSARGNFPDTGKPINDNVSSMEAFADRQCGAELAAGAPPAPLPPHRKGVAQPGVPPACDDVTHCTCLPEELRGGVMGTDEFNAKYIEDSHIVGNKFEVIFKKDFGKIYDIIHNNPGLSLDIELWFKDQSRPGHTVNDIWSTTQREGRHEMECVKSDLDAGTVRCTGNVTDVDLKNFDHEAGDNPIPGSGGTGIAYESDAVFDWCFLALPDPDNSNGLFLLQAIATPGGQCTIPGYSVACGTGCCRDNKKCCCFPNVGCQCVRSSCNCNNPKSSACSY